MSVHPSVDSRTSPNEGWLGNARTYVLSLASSTLIILAVFAEAQMRLFAVQACMEDGERAGWCRNGDGQEGSHSWGCVWGEWRGFGFEQGKIWKDFVDIDMRMGRSVAILSNGLEGFDKDVVVGKLKVVKEARQVEIGEGCHSGGRARREDWRCELIIVMNIRAF